MTKKDIFHDNIIMASKSKEFNVALREWEAVPNVPQGAIRIHPFTDFHCICSQHCVNTFIIINTETNFYVRIGSACVKLYDFKAGVRIAIEQIKYLRLPKCERCDKHGKNIAGFCEKCQAVIAEENVIKNNLRILKESIRNEKIKQFYRDLVEYFKNQRRQKYEFTIQLSKLMSVHSQLYEQICEQRKEDLIKLETQTRTEKTEYIHSRIHWPGISKDEQQAAHTICNKIMLGELLCEDDKQFIKNLWLRSQDLFNQGKNISYMKYSSIKCVDCGIRDGVTLCNNCVKFRKTATTTQQIIYCVRKLNRVPDEHKKFITDMDFKYIINKHKQWKITERQAKYVYSVWKKITDAFY